MITVDGCCGNQIIVGWKKPPQDPFIRTVHASAPPPLPPPQECAQHEPPPAASQVDKAEDPAIPLPNFTAEELAVLESFVRWLGGLQWPAVAEWQFKRSDEPDESGIISYLKGLHITPCIEYLLQSSLAPEVGDSPQLLIDVGAFAIEMEAKRGVMSRVTLVHETGTRQAVPVGRLREQNCSLPRAQENGEQHARRASVTLEVSAGCGKPGCVSVQIDLIA